MATSKGRGKRPQEGHDLSPDAMRVLRLFRVIFNSVRKHQRRTENRAGVSGAHVWALSVIREHPGVGVNELAATMDIHQSTASNLLRTLVDEELVVVERDTEDKRAVRLKTTAKGNRLLRSAPGPYAGVLPEALLELDPKVLKRLERDLHDLVQGLSPREDGAQVPLGISSR